MTQNKSVEEFATQLSKSVRYSSGRGQYDAFPDCQDAYLDGVETAIAMMYIDLTGGYKSEGMLAKFIQQERQTSQEREREVVGKLFEALDYQNTERELNAKEEDRMGIKLALQQFKLKLLTEYNITLTNPNKD